MSLLDVYSLTQHNHNSADIILCRMSNFEQIDTCVNNIHTRVTSLTTKLNNPVIFI